MAYRSLFLLLLVSSFGFYLSSHAALSQVHGAGSRSHLVRLPAQYTHKYELVHRNSYDDLVALLEAARRDGIRLSVFSAYRSYHHQKLIWDNKWGKHKNDDIAAAEKILQYSSLPGISRHHWGSDVDFNSVEISYWQSDEGKKVYDWLKNNAPTFGFCEVYNQGRQAGYLPEPWHWSHLEVANYYQEQLLDADVLNTALNQNIKGKQAIAALHDSLIDYIHDINDCNVKEEQSLDNSADNPLADDDLTNENDPTNNKSINDNTR